MKNIPSVDFWTREEFLNARKKQMSAQKQLDERNKRYGVVHVDAGDDIICDCCGEHILTNMINLIDYGRRAACGTCFNKSYANEPIRYRRLTIFGTLGDEVKVNSDGHS